MPAAILGMRGSGNYAAGERPKNYRQLIAVANPNGDGVLTFLLSKLKEQATNDPQFFWYEKGRPLQRATIYGASETITSAPADNADIAAAAGTTSDIAIKVVPIGGSSADTSIFRVGHILMNETTNEIYFVKKKLSVGGTDYLNVVRNWGGRYTIGSNEPAITGDTSAGDGIVIVGSGFPEGAPIGSATAYSPVKHYNYTQIHRTPLFMTRTARKTRLRWGDQPYREAKREALQMHGNEMEYGWLYSERAETTSLTTPDDVLSATSTGQPLRTTRGVLNWLPTALTSTTAGVHWNIGTANSGKLTDDILSSWCGKLFAYGSSQRVVTCGATFLSAVNQLVKKTGGEIELVPTQETYGFRFRRWLSPFGELMLYNHPLLSDNPSLTGDAFALDMDKLVYRYITDTVFLTNRQNPGDDASKDEFLTEAGLEVHFSGATPDSSDGLAAIAAPAVHGRLYGVTGYA